MIAEEQTCHPSDFVILAVDDYEPFLSMIQAMLETEGFVVWTAAGGQPALDLLLAQYKKLDRVPDLILADIMMPGMDGYTLYEAVRANPYLSHVPFLFLTAKVDVESIRKGKELGIDDYLTKPCSSEDLLASVRGKLRRAQQRQTLRTQFVGDPTRSQGGRSVVILAVGIVLILLACSIGAILAMGLIK